MPDQRGVYVCTCGFGFTGNGFICNPTRENLTHPLLIARGMAIIQRSTAADVPGRQVCLVNLIENAILAHCCPSSSSS
jgi:hypothetical protein